MTSVLEAGKNALPPAPQGWVIVGDDQISVAHGISIRVMGNPSRTAPAIDAMKFRELAQMLAR